MPVTTHLRFPALIATLQSLVAPTPSRRHRAARLIADDYPMLLASLPGPRSPRTVFDPAGEPVAGARVRVVSLAPDVAAGIGRTAWLAGTEIPGRTVEADADGAYAFPALPAGRHRYPHAHAEPRARTSEATRTVKETTLWAVLRCRSQEAND